MALSDRAKQNLQAAGFSNNKLSYWFNDLGQGFGQEQIRQDERFEPVRGQGTRQGRMEDARRRQRSAARGGSNSDQIQQAIGRLDGLIAEKREQIERLAITGIDESSLAPLYKELSAMQLQRNELIKYEPGRKDIGELPDAKGRFVDQELKDVENAADAEGSFGRNQSGYQVQDSEGRFTPESDRRAPLGQLGTPERPDLRTKEGFAQYIADLADPNGLGLNEQQIKGRLRQLRDEGVYDPVGEYQGVQDMGAVQNRASKLPGYGQDGQLGVVQDMVVEQDGRYVTAQTPEEIKRARPRRQRAFNDPDGPRELRQPFEATPRGKAAGERPRGTARDNGQLLDQLYSIVDSGELQLDQPIGESGRSKTVRELISNLEGSSPTRFDAEGRPDLRFGGARQKQNDRSQAQDAVASAERRANLDFTPQEIQQQLARGYDIYEPERSTSADPNFMRSSASVSSDDEAQVALNREAQLRRRKQLGVLDVDDADIPAMARDKSNFEFDSKPKAKSTAFTQEKMRRDQLEMRALEIAEQLSGEIGDNQRAENLRARRENLSRQFSENYDIAFDTAPSARSNILAGRPAYYGQRFLGAPADRFERMINDGNAMGPLQQFPIEPANMTVSRDEFIGMNRQQRRDAIEARGEMPNLYRSGATPTIDNVGKALGNYPINLGNVAMRAEQAPMAQPVYASPIGMQQQFNAADGSFQTPAGDVFAYGARPVAYLDAQGNFIESAATQSPVLGPTLPGETSVSPGVDWVMSKMSGAYNGAPRDVGREYDEFADAPATAAPLRFQADLGQGFQQLNQAFAEKGISIPGGITSIADLEVAAANFGQAFPVTDAETRQVRPRTFQETMDYLKFRGGENAINAAQALYQAELALPTRQGTSAMAPQWEASRFVPSSPQVRFDAASAMDESVETSIGTVGRAVVPGPDARKSDKTKKKERKQRVDAFLAAQGLPSETGKPRAALPSDQRDAVVSALGNIQQQQIADAFRQLDPIQRIELELDRISSDDPQAESKRFLLQEQKREFMEDPRVIQMIQGSLVGKAPGENAGRGDKGMNMAPAVSTFGPQPADTTRNIMLGNMGKKGDRAIRLEGEAAPGEFNLNRALQKEAELRGFARNVSIAGPDPRMQGGQALNLERPQEGFVRQNDDPAMRKDINIELDKIRIGGGVQYPASQMPELDQSNLYPAPTPDQMMGARAVGGRADIAREVPGAFQNAPRVPLGQPKGKKQASANSAIKKAVDDRSQRQEFTTPGGTRAILSGEPMPESMRKELMSLPNKSGDTGRKIMGERTGYMTEPDSAPSSVSDERMRRAVSAQMKRDRNIRRGGYAAAASGVAAGIGALIGNEREKRKEEEREQMIATITR